MMLLPATKREKFLSKLLVLGGMLLTGKVLAALAVCILLLFWSTIFHTLTNLTLPDLVSFVAVSSTTLVFLSVVVYLLVPCFLPRASTLPGLGRSQANARGGGAAAFLAAPNRAATSTPAHTHTQANSRGGGSWRGRIPGSPNSSRCLPATSFASPSSPPLCPAYVAETAWHRLALGVKASKAFQQISCCVDMICSVPPPLPPLIADPPMDKKLLILDLDETLVHSTYKTVLKYDLRIEVYVDGMSFVFYVLKRPHVDFFLRTVSGWYDVCVFTASLQKYADPVIDQLDRPTPSSLVKKRLFRESCVKQNGNFVKDLTIFGRDLSQVIIVDNSPVAYSMQPDNAIPIEGWIDSASDTGLLALLPLLHGLRAVADVRSILGKGGRRTGGCFGGSSSSSSTTSSSTVSSSASSLSPGDLGSKVR
eukprot:gnl/Hemi2/28244_TR9327_c0_g1_i1.p1 gnl/Hemi2/28244_TR9327_c0_g1~~gnl/Hemi2/28244_TR9327_c0_g1_i1.p1  ORF type:complete len:422 (+),score=79.28 gnl/Hemi2/28244_TR9327_c0_g1_i1:111-1376(+)